MRVAPRLTIRRLRVIQSALISKLADDLSDDVFSYEDYEAAADWVAYQQHLRETIATLAKSEEPMTAPLDIRVEDRCLTSAGKVARRRWCLCVNGALLSRHRWRENAEYRANQLREHAAEQVSA